MSRKGFVDKNLFDLKDRLSNYPESKTVESETDIRQPEKKDSLHHEKLKEKASAIPTEKNKIDPESNSKMDICEKKAPIDKEFSKALFERKKEFIRTRQDVLKKISNSLEQLPPEIQKHEEHLAEAKKIEEKLKFIVEDIKTIDERQWNKNDFSAALADAMKKIENARLELFTLQIKTNCLTQEETPGLEKQTSIIPEIISLAPWQIFKIGVSFFLPMIIGLLFAGIIVALAIFIAMGTI